MLNTSLNSIREILQQTFNDQSYISITPVLIGVMSFAFCIPFGPILRHKIGEKDLCSFDVFVSYRAIVSIASTAS